MSLFTILHNSLCKNRSRVIKEVEWVATCRAASGTKDLCVRLFVRHGFHHYPACGAALTSETARIWMRDEKVLVRTCQFKPKTASPTIRVQSPRDPSPSRFVSAWGNFVLYGSQVLDNSTKIHGKPGPQDAPSVLGFILVSSTTGK